MGTPTLGPHHPFYLFTWWWQPVWSCLLSDCSCVYLSVLSMVGGSVGKKVSTPHGCLVQNPLEKNM